MVNHRREKKHLISSQLNIKEHSFPVSTDKKLSPEIWYFIIPWLGEDWSVLQGYGDTGSKEVSTGSVTPSSKDISENAWGTKFFTSAQLSYILDNFKDKITWCQLCPQHIFQYTIVLGVRKLCPISRISLSTFNKLILVFKSDIALPSMFKNPYTHSRKSLHTVKIYIWLSCSLSVFSLISWKIKATFTSHKKFFLQLLGCSAGFFTVLSSFSRYTLN